MKCVKTPRVPDCALDGGALELMGAVLVGGHTRNLEAHEVDLKCVEEEIRNRPRISKSYSKFLVIVNCGVQFHGLGASY